MGQYHCFEIFFIQLYDYNLWPICDTVSYCVTICDSHIWYHANL